MNSGEKELERGTIEPAQQDPFMSMEVAKDADTQDSKSVPNTPDPSFRRRFTRVRKRLQLKDKVKLVMESNQYHFGVVFFILLDIGCVAAELLIEPEKHHYHFLEKFLKFFGLGILSLFMVELVVKISLFRGAFFHSKFEIFDAIVIVVSFSVDLAFVLNGVSPALGLITILRLWRLTRIINGILVTVTTRAQKRVDKYKLRLKRLHEENEKLKAQVRQQEDLLTEIKTVYSVYLPDAY